MKRLFAIFCSMLCLWGWLSAQTTVSGTLTQAETGEPLVGATILEKGTNNGVFTDENGVFKIALSGTEAVLVSHLVGYVTLETLWRGESELALSMESVLNLEEIVIVGYGSQKKEDVTGAVASVSEERLENVPNTNFAQALRGAVPGISVNQTSASAEGSANNIVIRGQNSLSANNGPLIVLDGVPYGANIAEINPVDIESIEVLKDASAAAIYGSRGANGVILITTKQGKGSAKFSYNGYYGVQQIANLPPVMTGPAFYEFKQTREPGSITASEQAVFDAGTWTDWIDLATRNGAQQQHTISISGGNDKSNYYISGSYLNAEGIAVNDQFDRYTLRINFGQDLANWLKIGTNTQLSLADRGGVDANFSDAFYMNPLTEAFDSLGNQLITPWQEDPFFGNPLEGLLAIDEDISYKIFSNNFLQVDFPFLKGLSYRINTGTEFQLREELTYYGQDTQTGRQVNGRSDVRTRRYLNLLAENLLYYNREFGKHSVGFTGLLSYQSNTLQDNDFRGTGFLLDELYFQIQDAALLVPDPDFEKRNIVSQMIRLNYSFDARYALTLTGRRDGYSGFGAERKFGVFPSAAFAWNIGNEAFMENVALLSSLKLRVSYGQNGNQAVGPYQTLPRLTSADYLDGATTAPGYRPIEIGNPNLGWETSTNANLGIDYAFWNGRLQGSFDFYQTQTIDLLQQTDISTVHGIDEVLQNIGETRNRGFEMIVKGVPVSNKDWQWSIEGNLSLNRNEIVSLVDDTTDNIVNRWFIGQPIQVNWDFVYDGVWQEEDDIANSAQPDALPGYARVQDVNGDTLIDDDDRTFIGSRQPDFIWGINTTLTYKRFSLNVFIHGVQGVTRRNVLQNDDVFFEVRRNSLQREYWTPENPINSFWANDIDANNLGVRIYENASFIRLKDVTLSYDFPTQVTSLLKLSGLNLYVNGRNLLTITEWTGLDPELSSQRAVPLQRSFIFGARVSF